MDGMLRASGPQHPPLKDGSAGAWRERGDFTHLNSTVSPMVFFSCHVDDVCFFRLSRVYFNMASATGFFFFSVNILIGIVFVVSLLRCRH